MQEIRDLFRKNEKKQLKDIKILALQYGKAGRGTATDYEGKKVDGISYLRAMDCLFYMLLLKEDIDKYRELIRGKSSILLSIAGFINNKNYTKGIESIEYNYIFDATMELGEIIEILAKIKDKLVNKEEVSEEEQKIRTFSIDRDILLGVIQIDYIIKIINQLSAPVLERYLVADNYSWCREERQIALFLYNILLMKKNNYYEIIEGLNNKKNEEINEGLKEIFEDDFKNIVIHEVYYEAAILRDYFHSLNEDVDRAADFNVSLLEFLLGEDEKANISSIIDKYFEGDKGKKTAKSLTGATSALYKIICSNQIWGIEENDLKYQEDIIDYEKIIKLQKVYFATMIMNAKPDILVVYSNNKKNDKRKRAIVLECKFESNAGMYKDYKNRDTIN